MSWATTAAGYGRAFLEGEMTSTCTVREKPTQTTDPSTGKVTNTPGATVYSGKCRIRPAQTWGRVAVLAGAQITPDTFLVDVPITVTGVRRGHETTIDSCPDPDLVGRTFYVRFTPDAGDGVSARRLLCEEQS